jgi:FixJ family two-component response regulator
MLRHGLLRSGTQFIQKPFSLQALARSVRHALDETALADVAG